MSFAKMMTDTVDLLKKDGTRVPGLKASVQKNEIVTFESSVLIEPKDLLIRKASNGAEETFEVIDPRFHEKFGSIPASYQIEVRKLGIPEAKQHIQNITYNVTGAGARINYNSVDNSVNTILVSSDVQSSLDVIRNEIQKSDLPLVKREEALDVVKELEEQFASGKPKKTIVTALLGALPSIATITKAISSIAEAI